MDRDLFGGHLYFGRKRGPPKGRPGRPTIPREIRVCANSDCGKQFEVRATSTLKCCSKACGYALARQIAPSKQCAWCGNPYRSRYSSQRFCSVDCTHAWQKEEGKQHRLDRLPKPRIVYEKQCPGCGVEFETAKASLVYHSSKCRYKHKELVPLAPVRCAECHRYFIPKRGRGRRAKRLYCSDRCSRRHHKRTWRTKRKALERSNGYDSVDPFEVFERDDWKCQLCGRPTPRSLRGTFDPQAPELDHIVALTSGGRHVLDNLQCSCRRCNSEKGNGTLASIARQLQML